MKIFHPYTSQINESTIFIGHSLGPAFILSILEKLKTRVKACFFVAGFTGLLGNDEFDQLNKTFTVKLFNWKKITQNCQKFYIFNSTDDPYVPIEKGQELADNLSSTLIRFEKAGHFNTSSGFTEFPELLDYVMQLLD